MSEPGSRTTPGSRRTADVVVIGGGSVGCAIALALVGEGVRVHLLERKRLASQASGAAAGMLAPVAEASGVGPFLRFGAASLALYPEFCADLRERSGVDPEYIRSGILRVARSDREAEALRAKAAAVTAAPLTSPFDDSDCRLALEWLDAGALRDLEPALSDDVVGGLWSPDEAQVRSPQLTRAYAGAARALGCTIEEDSEALGLIRRGGRVRGVRTTRGAIGCNAVVLSAGCWSGEWLEGAGGLADEAASRRPDALPRLPIVPERGQILSVANLSSPLRRILWSGDTYLVPKADGQVVIGATQEDAGFDCRVTEAGLDGLLGEAQSLIPAFAGAQIEMSWAGLRPKSPDGLPNIGPISGFDGLYAACGHYRNGVLLSAVTARLVRDLIFGKELPSDARAFDPERWG